MYDHGLAIHNLKDLICHKAQTMSHHSDSVLYPPCI